MVSSGSNPGTMRTGLWCSIAEMALLDRCSSAVAGVYSMIVSGQADLGIALGAEKLSKRGGGFLPLVEDDLDSSMGRVMPAAFGMIARLYMETYGATLEQLALVTLRKG